MIRKVYDLKDAITALDDLERNANTNDSFKVISEEITAFFDVLWDVIKQVEAAEKTIETQEEQVEELQQRVDELEAAEEERK